MDLQLQRDKSPPRQLTAGMAGMVELRVYIFKNKYNAQKVDRKLGKALSAQDFHQRHAFYNKAMPPKLLQTVPLTGDLVFKYPTLEPVRNILNKRLQNSEKDLGVLYLNFIFFFVLISS